MPVRLERTFRTTFVHNEPQASNRGYGTIYAIPSLGTDLPQR